MNIFFNNKLFLSVVCFNLFLSSLSFGKEKLSFSANNLQTISNDSINQRIFKNNVQIQKEDLYLFSDVATHYPDSFQIHLSGQVRLYSDMDSLFCDELILYDQELTRFYATGNINFYKNNQKIQSTNLNYITLDTLKNVKIELDDKVIVSDTLRIISGDSLFLNYTDSLISKFIIKDNAKIINSRYAKINSKNNPQIFNDIFESKKIKIDFENNFIKYIEMDGMSSTKFNAIKDSIVNGQNTLSGDSILIYLNNEQIDYMKILGDARGVFYPEKNNSDIEFELKYNADRIDYNLINEESFLVNNAKVEYGETILNAGEIYSNWQSNQLEARIKDNIHPSVSGFSDSPTFGDLLIYDLVNKKGKILKGNTEYGTGSGKMYYKGEEIYRNNDLTYHVANSILTSCDHEHPHYYFKSNKMKMVPNQNIYAKPMTFYIQDYPIFALPFAIFPNKEGNRSSGWVMPSFGNNGRGTYMNDLGFYYAPNDYIDNLFSFDVYDRDGIEYSSKFRYKHNSAKNWYQSLEGSIYYKKYTRFDTTKVEYKDIFKLFNKGDYIEDEDIIVKHNQKFNPLNSLSIDYKRYSNTNFEKISLKEKLNQKNITKINYVRHFDNNAYLTLGYNYNNDMLLTEPSDANDRSTYSSTIGPDLSYTIPMRNLFNTNNNQWFEKIKFNYGLRYSDGSESYTKESCLDRDRDGLCDDSQDTDISCIDDNQDGECDYSLSTCSDIDQDGLCDECIDENGDSICDNCIDDNEDGICDDNYSWSSNEIIKKNYGGLQNDLSFVLSSPFELINITPRINFRYDIVNNYTCVDDNQDYLCDQNIEVSKNKYADRFSWDSSIKISTDIYGLLPFNLFNLNTIRHKLSPELTFTYKPRGGTSFFNVNQLYYLDNNDALIDILNETNARPLSINKTNTILFSLNNQFMAKRNNENNPIHLFEYSLSTSFNNNNIEKFSPLLADLRIKKPNGDKIIDVDFLYNMYDEENNLYIKTGKMPKLKSINFNMSHTFNLNSSSDGLSNSFKSENDSTRNTMSTLNNMFDLENYKPEFSNGKLWDATIRLSADAIYEDSKWNIESPNMTLNGGFNLTNNWILTYSGNYDFDKGTITIPTFNLSRDLHCWNFNFMWRPSGYSKGFRLKINLKNPDLQDVKVRSTSSNFRN